MVGNLGHQSGVVTRAGTGVICAARTDLPNARTCRGPAARRFVLSPGGYVDAVSPTRVPMPGRAYGSSANEGPPNHLRWIRPANERSRPRRRWGLTLRAARGGWRATAPHPPQGRRLPIARERTWPQA